MKDIGNTKHIAGCLMAVNPFHQEQYKKFRHENYRKNASNLVFNLF